VRRKAGLCDESHLSIVACHLECGCKERAQCRVNAKNHVSHCKTAATRASERPDFCDPFSKKVSGEKISL
jgi:hypothetical protein